MVGPSSSKAMTCGRRSPSEQACSACRPLANVPADRCGSLRIVAESAAARTKPDPIHCKSLQIVAESRAAAEKALLGKESRRFCPPYRSWPRLYPFTAGTELTHADRRPDAACRGARDRRGARHRPHPDAPALDPGDPAAAPVRRFVAPACVIDCSKEAAADDKFLLEPAHIQTWERKHGQLPKGAWVLMRTDWSKRTTPDAFLNMKDDGPHVPGPSAAAIRFLVEQRDVNGWGVEAVGTDAGMAFGFEPAFPAHHLMHGANKLSLANLDQLPPTG